MTEVQTREQIDRWIEHAVAPLRERIEALEANFRTTRRPKARPSAASLHIRPPSPSSAESGDSKLPLQYEDGPDYCTVRDAQGRDFALTMQPDLMKAMEKALSDEITSFMRAPAHPHGPTEPLQCLRCGTIDAFGPVSKKDTANG